MSESFNGWTNWETWSVDVLLSNDEGLYNDTLDILANALPLAGAADLKQYVINDVPESLLDGVNLGVVDWDEIVEAWADMSEELSNG